MSSLSYEYAFTCPPDALTAAASLLPWTPVKQVRLALPRRRMGDTGMQFLLHSLVCYVRLASDVITEGVGECVRVAVVGGESLGLLWLG